ncbi:hypothetical protein [Methylobacterium oryzihabitans]|uniref:Uncharacterized protein n=1 Tax=Methylobacterium oryzihabitans TaxID=2499852 RepID=A0A3S2YWP1_9HYPH|nr:hypothetical protein [Methylobacterium oryzihabitans]RVU21120.1 hypothetical protein EOE48_03215 [Methylobacterium oryzihabitans]
MSETRKPINPLEREEKVGIADGSDHAGEAVTTGRHGTGIDLTADETAKGIATATRTDARPERDPSR